MEENNDIKSIIYLKQLNKYIRFIKYIIIYIIKIIIPNFSFYKIKLIYIHIIYIDLIKYKYLYINRISI